MQPSPQSRASNRTRRGLGWSAAVVCLLTLGCTPSETDLPEPMPKSVAEFPDQEPFLPREYAALMTWPDVFLVQGEERYLWVEAGQVLRIHRSSSALELEVSEDPELIQGLDGLVAAARGPDGIVAFLDASGRVSLRQEGTETRWDFRIGQETRAESIAVSREEVFLLRASREPQGAAVVAFTFDGQPSGQWGEMPADAAVQAKLSGGGLAVCPDGSVYFSYINSPKVVRLGDRVQGTVQPFREGSTSFQLLDEDQIRKANQSSKRAGSVKDLVQLGLQASRVMALFCSADGVLFRQVAQPRAGSFVEVIDPGPEQLLDTIPVGTRVLLGVEQHTLYLGDRLPQGRGLYLEYLDYEPQTEG